MRIRARQLPPLLLFLGVLAASQPPATQAVVNKPEKLQHQFRGPHLEPQGFRQPNILLVLVDDLGYNDVGFSQAASSFGREWGTPALDALASRGTVLSNYYVQPLCSPTRASLMTARYPHTLGLATGIVANGVPMAVPRNETLLPERLQDLG